jgi:hypothetical protein
VNRARQLLACVLLGIFVYIVAGLSPAFLRNLRLQRYVEALTQSEDIRTQRPEAVRAQVVERAAQLGLPVRASDVQVEPGGAGARLAVRYVVPVRFPGYVVKLHFSPSAGR